MKGEVVYLYAFDVANEIVTANVTYVLGLKAAPFDVRVDRTYPKDVPLYRPRRWSRRRWQVCSTAGRSSSWCAFTTLVW